MAKLVLFSISWFVLGVLTLSLWLPRMAYGEDARDQVLKDITETAKEICQSPPLEQSGSSTELKGDAKAKVAGLLGRLADLGVSGAAQFQSNKSMGVLQKDLAESIKSGNDCRFQVFKTLTNKFLPDAQPSFAATTNGTPVGNITQGPCSALQIGGSNNQAAGATAPRSY